SGPVLEAILKELPVPVVGVPWTQMGHLADALGIGHEVGHLVAGDFGLKPALEAAVRKTPIPDARRPAWNAWLDEAFADVNACPPTGPAFVATLIDFLVADAQAIESQTIVGPEWGDYPTNALRVRLNLRTLRALGFEDEASTLAGLWDK